MDIAKENLKEADVRLLLDFAHHHVGDFAAWLRRQGEEPRAASILAVRDLAKRISEKRLD